MFSRMGSAAYKKDLTNIRLLCEQLGNPQEGIRTIHVGGTNGKGSVSHMLAATLQTAGYRTGLYTSPHLFDFRERIRVDGAMIDKDFVIGFTERIRPLIEQVEPSFFEITVLMAFEYFRQKEVDVAIIEVGLGGRLDSTNIITPQLSVITNIGWDHMNILGDTLEAIATEKAGIIKQGIPVVIGEKKAATEMVFRDTATQKQAPLYFAEERFTVQRHQWQEGRLQVEILDRNSSTLHSYALELQGIYQLQNICTVLQSVALLQEQGYAITEEQLDHALQNTIGLTGLHGRWEVIGQEPTIVLEVAHNKDGIEKMLQHLSSVRYEQLHLVTGMVKDKDIDSVLSLMPQQAQYYFTNAQIPRALPAAELAEKAAALGLKGKVYEDVNVALEAAKRAAGPKDLVIVCGSIFLVAEVNRG